MIGRRKGERPMRGRRPRPLALAAEDRGVLMEVAARRRCAWFEVQHARILLDVAAGERIATVAAQQRCDPATVWRVCRRYEFGGVQAILQEGYRSGAPASLSPLATGADRGTGLSGAGRRRAASDPLVQ